jgi:hypothetical protein
MLPKRVPQDARADAGNRLVFVPHDEASIRRESPLHNVTTQAFLARRPDYGSTVKVRTAEPGSQDAARRMMLAFCNPETSMRRHSE